MVSMYLFMILLKNLNHFHSSKPCIFCLFSAAHYPLSDISLVSSFYFFNPRIYACRGVSMYRWVQWLCKPEVGVRSPGGVKAVKSCPLWTGLGSSVESIFTLNYWDLSPGLTVRYFTFKAKWEKWSAGDLRKKKIWRQLFSKCLVLVFFKDYALLFKMIKRQKSKLFLAIKFSCKLN